MIPPRADAVVAAIDNEAQDCSSGNRKRSRPSHASLTRQVSHEALTISEVAEKENKAKSSDGRGSPVRCVTEFDKAASATCITSTFSTTIPPLPIPIHNPSMLAHHTCALQLEAELQPMRLILSRLMAHPTFNRKGIFNAAVDPVALGLPDYFTVITKPMDLGTIKVRLHALAYTSQFAVAEDIRLVFHNAMKYNPARNGVHMSARDLLAFFEEQYQAFVPEAFPSSMPTAIMSCLVATASAAASCALSTTCQLPTNAMAKTPPLENNILRTVPSEPDSQLRQSEGLAVLASKAIITTDLKAAPLLVHTQGTRTSTQAELLSPTIMTTVRKRKKRGTRSNPLHSCQSCKGRTCLLCKHGCLHMEPTLLICNGPHCAGAKIRKGAVYYIARDGSRQYCDRCHTGLPAVLPSAGQDDACRYKRDLLKRKNDEEVVERWLSCTKCDRSFHQVCAMHNEHAHSEDDYVCPVCVVADSQFSNSQSDDSSATEKSSGELYTFLTGADLPVKMSLVSGESFRPGEDVLSADALPETDVSSFVQRKVRERMTSIDCVNAEQTVVVRIISDCNRFFKVPEVVRTHFRMASSDAEVSAGRGTAEPPTKVNYRSKAIALFQKVDGLDVCIFCMYVQEYGGDDEFASTSTGVVVPQNKRVYIAYLDSVEHFRPRPCRTSVYHEMLVSYLATARKRGFETAHIWACPPSRGNSFVFWNHPASQRTPNRERLIAWYHGALSRAVDCGVVTDVNSLYETDFKRSIDTFKTKEDITEDANLGESGRMLCPPLLEGDFWIEEAVRIHSISIARNLKSKSTDGEVRPLLLDAVSSDELDERCPARQMAILLRDRVIVHPSSTPFRRAVNAAAMKLKDYHQIISKPMDLGTVYSQCILGEYRTLQALVSDVDLVCSNAMRYNPKGHFVHSKAIELKELFYAELNQLTSSWRSGTESSWTDSAAVSMSLDASLGTALREEGTICVGGSVATAPRSDNTRERASGPMQRSELLGGGAEAVLHRMVGSDKWLLDKRSTSPPKSAGLLKASVRKKKHSDFIEEPPAKRRRQSWLGEEVAAAVRRMRTSFFTCSLVPQSNMSKDEQGKAGDFGSYTDLFEASGAKRLTPSRIADARHALLEFSQFRNLEFDTLRRAKYSTATLLYHLHNNEAPGMVATCSSCNHEIEDVRWHKVRKVVEIRQGGRVTHGGRKLLKPVSTEPEELCSACHSKHPDGDQFIPLQVSFRHTYN